MWLYRVASPADWLCCGLCHSVTGSMWGMVAMITSFWKVMCNRVWPQEDRLLEYRQRGSIGLKQYLTTLTEDKVNFITVVNMTSLHSCPVVFTFKKGEEIQSKEIVQCCISEWWPSWIFSPWIRVVVLFLNKISYLEMEIRGICMTCGSPKHLLAIASVTIAQLYMAWVTFL